MKIKKITLKRFKRLKDKTFEFTDGLNIIKGNDNEVGKSTLQTAIVKALYQNPSSKGKEVLELTTWGEDKLWELEIEVEENSKLYTIKKNLNTGSGALLVRGITEIKEDKEAISRKIAEITGCPSEAFFMSTVCIKQDEIIKLIPDRISKTERQQTIGEISSRLQATISGSEGVDVPSIISKLYEKTHRKDAKGPYYQIGQLNAQIVTIEREKFGMEEKVNRLVTNRRRLVQIKDELKQIEIDLVPERGLLEKNKKILDYEGEIKRNKELYQNYKRAKKLHDDLESQDELLTKYKIFENSDARINELKLNIDRVGRPNEQKKNLESEVENLKNKKLPAWALIISLLFFIVGVLGLFITKYSWIVSLIGIFLLSYWFYSYQDKKKQIRFVTDKVDNFTLEIKGVEVKISETTREFGFDDYKKCLDAFEDYKVQLDKRKDLSNKLSGIIGEKNWLQYKQENEDLDIRISAAQKELEKLEPFKKEPLEFQKLETEVNTFEESKSNLEKERGGLEKFFDLTDADPDQLTNITEQLGWLQKEKEFWEKQNRIFEITQQVLEEAHKETLLRATDAVRKELGNYISLITDERYQDVEIDERDLSIYAFSPEKHDKVNITELSRATQDQFYICVRLALIKQIANGKNPPLLLDDPFVNFHKKRLKRMMLLLQELSKIHQILLFTCSDMYDAYGTVIQVDVEHFPE